MSKGYGAVQRALLACLEAQPREYQRWKLHGYVTHAYPAWHSVDSVAGDVFSADGERTEPTRAQVESVRRAAKGLAAKGLAEIAYVTVTVTRRNRRHAAPPRISPVLPSLARRVLRSNPKTFSATRCGHGAVRAGPAGGQPSRAAADGRVGTLRLESDDVHVRHLKSPIRWCGGRTGGGRAGSTGSARCGRYATARTGRRSRVAPATSARWRQDRADGTVAGAAIASCSVAGWG